MNSLPKFENRPRDAHHSWLRRQLIHKTVICLLYLLRWFILFAVTYGIVLWPQNKFIQIHGRIWQAQWRTQGFVIIALDASYAPRVPSEFDYSHDFISSILASSTSSQWPYASWIVLPRAILLPTYLLAAAFFWYLTCPIRIMAKRQEEKDRAAREGLYSSHHV